MKVFCTLLALLAGCSLISSPEQECLSSQKLYFRDPNSVQLTANLGKRGSTEPGDWFWIRYKAKNALGAFDQENMACRKVGDKWEADRARERRTIDREEYDMSKAAAFDKVMKSPENLYPR